MRDDEDIERALHLIDPTRPPDDHLSGLHEARWAMRMWRAAPVRLAPALAVLARTGRPDVAAEAVRALGSSLASTRATADLLVPMLDDPVLGRSTATALGGVGDRRADEYLLRMVRAGVTERRLSEALTVMVAQAIDGTGGDPARFVAVARETLAAYPDGSDPSRMALRMLEASGPAAADAVPELTDRIVRAVDRCERLHATAEMRVLAAIGPAACDAVPLLRWCATRPHATEAARALVMITSDRTFADRYLADELGSRAPSQVGCQLLVWLAERGGLTADQHRLARLAFGDGILSQTDVAAALWHHEGPASAPDLLDVLTVWLDNDYFGPVVLRLFATMGRHARPALGRLDELIGRRMRISAHIGDPDAEMRADETWRPLAIGARQHIAGRPDGVPAG